MALLKQDPCHNLKAARYLRRQVSAVFRSAGP
jgi:hypothetical protein